MNKSKFILFIVLFVFLIIALDRFTSVYVFDIGTVIARKYYYSVRLMEIFMRMNTYVLFLLIGVFLVPIFKLRLASHLMIISVGLLYFLVVFMPLYLSGYVYLTSLSIIFLIIILFGVAGVEIGFLIDKLNKSRGVSL